MDSSLVFLLILAPLVLVVFPKNRAALAFLMAIQLVMVLGIWVGWLGLGIELLRSDLPLLQLIGVVLLTAWGYTLWIVIEPDPPDETPSRGRQP